MPKSNPVWDGPESDADNGGITYSLLCRFLNCRERFRLRVVEGLKTKDQFNHRLEFGNMWHLCEEAMADYAGSMPDERIWGGVLLRYVQDLSQRYKFSREEIHHWYDVCRVMFPLYVDYWSKHSDVKRRTPLLQETVFKVPYSLPSGRTVYLRGKWDSVDLIDKAVYLQENKTKGDPKESQIMRQLSFDMQTMMYILALHTWEPEGTDWPGPISGVRYNVVKRPRQYQGKRESREEFLDRLQDFVATNPQDFFMRWRVEISPADVTKFRRQCLDPILEQLCDWWQWIWSNLDPFEGVSLSTKVTTHPNTLHWRHPFGLYNVLDEGGSSDLDEYMDTGSEAGLERNAELFQELQ